MTGKREFLREHHFTVLDWVVWLGSSALVTLPMFYGLIWLMDLAIGVAAPIDAVLMLVLLTFLLSGCVGLGFGLTLVRRMARRRARKL